MVPIASPKYVNNAEVWHATLQNKPARFTISLQVVQTANTSD